MVRFCRGQSPATMTAQSGGGGWLAGSDAAKRWRPAACGSAIISGGAVLRPKAARHSPARDFVPRSAHAAANAASFRTGNVRRSCQSRPLLSRSPAALIPHSVSPYPADAAKNRPRNVPTGGTAGAAGPPRAAAARADSAGAVPMGASNEFVKGPRELLR